jgi:hypothetical protein
MATVAKPPPLSVVVMIDRPTVLAKGFAPVKPFALRFSRLFRLGPGSGFQGKGSGFQGKRSGFRG